MHEMHLAGHLIQAAVALVRAAVTSIPFSTWSNRTPGPMRVWLPRAPR
jgi:DUF1680 family protein